MKFIAKPIKRGRITESALAAVILSGDARQRSSWQTERLSEV